MHHLQCKNHVTHLGVERIVGEGKLASILLVIFTQQVDRILVTVETIV